MTTKNLSHKLCEICGIEGKWIEYTTETTDGCVNSGKKRVFPDFTQPENFVRLLNTNTDYITKNNKKILCKSIWWYINSDAKRFGQIAPYEIDTFLITLILILKNKDNLYNQSEIDKIKQAIKSEVWKYA